MPLTKQEMLACCNGDWFGFSLLLQQAAMQPGILRLHAADKARDVGMLQWCLIWHATVLPDLAMCNGACKQG